MAAAHLIIPEEPVPSLVATLLGILLAVLVGPMACRKIEENLEPFFLLMGAVGFTAIYVAGVVPGAEEAKSIVLHALKAPVSIGGLPIGITQVVLAAGLFFHFFRERISGFTVRAAARMGLPLFVFLFFSTLGLLSSVISVIVASVILSEIMALLPMPKKKRVELTVYACLSLGLGAALTPVGEPLSTIAVSKLSGPPYYADFFFLLRLLGAYIIPGILAASALAAARARGIRLSAGPLEAGGYAEETLRSVVWRAVKVYMFVAGLELLGTSFLPLVEWYFTLLPPMALYWLNTISAVVDNATLTAAEIGPTLTLEQIRSALMSLLVSGVMLVPGNIPNIVAAGRLKIRFGEWARHGIPVGVAFLAAYFVALFVV